ncbi:MAG: coniferyl aldehyde dehydrogenase [Natronospirillum sp.]
MMSEQPTLEARFARQKAAFETQRYPDLLERKRRLRLLRRLVAENQELICTAISVDFGHRSHDETQFAEIIPTLSAIDYHLKKMPGWLRPERRLSHWTFWPSRAAVHYQPKGVAGIIVPWNYPLYLATGPLISALTAGNHAMIKMSEATPEFSACFASLVARYFDSSLVTVVEGDVDVAVAFGQLPFDHLLFTGSTTVGKAVMRAAAEHLTPVTLELGGKSPAFIGPRAPIKEAAERIAFAKGMNAGQTCVAPDYVLVQEDQAAAFIEHYKQAMAGFYADYIENPDYSAVVNDRQRKRLLSWFNEAVKAGAKWHAPWTLADDWQKQIKLPPLVITDAPDNTALMQEEIFGPWLPLVTYRQEADAIAYINARPRPLALYYFGYDARTRETLLAETHSGGMVVNNALVHVAYDQLPFGGIGPSGMGAYHGFEGFQTFSHARAVVRHGRLSAIPLIFPPFGRGVHKLMQRLVGR